MLTGGIAEEVMFEFHQHVKKRDVIHCDLGTIWLQAKPGTALPQCTAGIRL